MNIKKSIAVIVTFILVICMIASAGCSSRGWRGTFNREGDATFARGILTVTSVKSKGFEFAFTVYAGNVAGQLSGFAEFGEDKTSARWNLPKEDIPGNDDNPGFIDFFLRDGGIEVVFLGVDPEVAAQAEEEAVEIKDTSYTFQGGGTEETLLGFAPGGFLSGRFVRGKVDYLNTNLIEQINDNLDDERFLIPEEYNKQMHSLTTEEVYTRFMDCFMSVRMWENEDTPTRERHHDPIGGYIYYGGNPMQEYAAIIIVYDDESVSAVTSRENAGLVYVTNNHVYTAKTDPPEPIAAWIRGYNAEQDRIKRMAVGLDD